MLTKTDLKGIEKLLEPIKRVQSNHTRLLDKHGKSLDGHGKRLDGHGKRLGRIEEKLDTNTASTTKIEQDIKAALELRQDVSGIRQTVKGHEERISNLEKF